MKRINLKQHLKEWVVAMIFMWMCIQFMGCSNMQIERETAYKAIAGVN